MSTNVYAIASVSLVSVISLLGVFAISMKPRSLAKMTFLLVSLATGCMLGNAIVHLIPESYENVIDGKISSFAVSLLMLGGFLFCFALQKVNGHWQHSGTVHNEPCHCDHPDGDHASEPDADHAPEPASGLKHIHHTGHMSLLAHGMDNLTDGILIAVTYLASIPAGIATTVSIISHEIPMEFGGFGVLVKAGFKPWQAVFINFLSALVALTGTVGVLIADTYFKSLPLYLTPIGAGVVVYLVAAGLVPMLQQERDVKRSLVQIAIMGTGVLIMVLAKMFEAYLGV
jgi:zinc and cadmium transporter